MLSERYADKMESILVSRDDWHPYATVEDRDDWGGLPDAVQAAHLKLGESVLGFEWPSLPATLFLEYARMGNRSHYQDVRNVRRNTLRDLVVAECLEGDGRFLEDISNGIWTTCEETYWGVPAHIGVQKAGKGLPDAEEPTVDLFAAETLSLLAWTYYLLSDRLDSVSPLIRSRIVYESQRRALTPCLEGEDFSWMGFHGRSVNNWNPWICSNWLTGTLLLEEDAGRRLASVKKILQCLDAFIKGYHSDGGCDEGPGYWGRAGASLFDNLEILYSATDGAMDVYTQPLIRNMGQFIYRAQIADHYFVNFADASAVVTPSPSLTFRYGKAIGDRGMVALGAWAAREQNLDSGVLNDSLARQLPALFALDALAKAEPGQPLPRDVWLDGIQFFSARDVKGKSEGFYVATKGGHNAESHNHNDVGNFIVYVDGRPVIADAGVETYTAKTFSSTRYELWTMQSAYHSLPTVNNVQQSPGREFAGSNVFYSAGDDQAEFVLDIARAYPKEAGIKSWTRTVCLVRDEEVIVTDRFDLRGAMGETSMHLMTPCDVTVEDGVLVLQETTFGRDRVSGAARVDYDAEAFDVDVESVEITDDKLGGVWGDHLNRIVLVAKHATLHGEWKFRITR
jgi:hypothetical protein